MTSASLTQIKELNLSDLKVKGFKVLAISGDENPSAHARRDFYKIGMVTGDITLYYGERVFEIKGTYLFCGNPHVAHSVIHHTPSKGYVCLFTEQFIESRGLTASFQQSPLHQLDAAPLIPVNKQQVAFITGLYQQMLAAYNGEYDYKDELLRSCTELIIHETLREQPQQSNHQNLTAAARVTRLFLDRLERQFPIEGSADRLKLRTAQDFAVALSIHVNYLNRSVKMVTGKPTSVHIAERIVEEAKALLHHTDWNVADIAYALGFEYPTYFNNYFKRLTGLAPQSFRKGKV